MFRKKKTISFNGKKPLSIFTISELFKQKRLLLLLAFFATLIKPSREDSQTKN